MTPAASVQPETGTASAGKAEQSEKAVEGEPASGAPDQSATGKAGEVADARSRQAEPADPRASIQRAADSNGRQQVELSRTTGAPAPKAPPQVPPETAHAAAGTEVSPTQAGTVRPDGAAEAPPAGTARPAPDTAVPSRTAKIPPQAQPGEAASAGPDGSKTGQSVKTVPADAAAAGTPEHRPDGTAQQPEDLKARSDVASTEAAPDIKAVPATQATPAINAVPETAIAASEAVRVPTTSSRDVAPAEPKPQTGPVPAAAGRDPANTAWSAPSFADMPSRSEITGPERLLASAETPLTQGDTSSSMNTGPAQSSVSTSPSAVTAGQNAQFMQAMRAQAPVVATPAEITEIIQTRLAGQDGGDRVTVQLDPPELGRVSIDFKFDAQGLQHVTITGETPEALRQLRQVHFQLTQALEQQGLSGQDMTFRQQSSSQQQQHHHQQPGARGLSGPAGELVPDMTTQAAIQSARGISPGGGLDMKI